MIIDEWIVEVPGKPHLTQRYRALEHAKQRVRDLFSNSPITGERYANSVQFVRVVHDATRVNFADIESGAFDECFPS